MRSRNPIILPQVTIEGMAAKGKAFGRAADQRIVFVPYAAPGDIADIRVTKKRSNYYEGVIETLHKASPDRIEPKCAHFGLCGGCKWQHISYEAQLAGKQDEVVQHLKRIGGVSPEHIGEILGCEDPYYYRNKMEFSFSDSKWLTPEEIASDKNIILESNPSTSNVRYTVLFFIIFLNLFKFHLALSFAQKILILDEFFFKNGISLCEIFLIPNEIADTFG